jgi:hypothetical protein
MRVLFLPANRQNAEIFTGKAKGVFQTTSQIPSPIFLVGGRVGVSRGPPPKNFKKNEGSQVLRKKQFSDFEKFRPPPIL